MVKAALTTAITAHKILKRLPCLFNIQLSWNLYLFLNFTFTYRRLSIHTYNRGSTEVYSQYTHTYICIYLQSCLVCMAYTGEKYLSQQLP